MYNHEILNKLKEKKLKFKKTEMKEKNRERC